MENEKVQIYDVEVQKRINAEVTNKEGIPAEQAQNSSIVTFKEVANFSSMGELPTRNNVDYLFLKNTTINNTEIAKIRVVIHGQDMLAEGMDL